MYLPRRKWKGQMLHVYVIGNRCILQITYFYKELCLLTMRDTTSIY